MIDFRYHLASLMAIFLALGIGILIGNSFVGLASVEPQMKRLQRDVQENIRAGQQENATLKQEVSEEDRGIRALAPRAVQGLLAGRRIALVTVGRQDRRASLTELASLLTDAGATVTSMTTLRRNWLPTEPALRTRIVRRLGVLPGNDDARLATRALAAALVSGDWSSALHDVAQWSPEVRLNGTYANPVGAVVLIAAPDDSGEPAGEPGENDVEAALLEPWKERGLRIVAGESETARESMVPFLRSQGVATVDNIDTAVGEVACAMAIVAGAGNYGVKPTAEEILPELPAESASPEGSGARQPASGSAPLTGTLGSLPGPRGRTAGSRAGP